jgi:hypothetical protein
MRIANPGTIQKQAVGSANEGSGSFIVYTEVEIPPVVRRYGKRGTRHVVYMRTRCRAAYRQENLLPTTDNSTHWASIASASVTFTTRTGSFSSSASFAVLRRRAPATTSYVLFSSSRTRRGARIPCVLKLAAFCVVDHFVAEGSKRHLGMGAASSPGICFKNSLAAAKENWGIWSVRYPETRARHKSASERPVLDCFALRVVASLSRIVDGTHWFRHPANLTRFRVRSGSTSSRKPPRLAGYRNRPRSRRL